MQLYDCVFYIMYVLEPQMYNQTIQPATQPDLQLPNPALKASVEHRILFLSKQLHTYKIITSVMIIN